MSWQVIIELNNCRSPYLDEIIDLADRVSNGIKREGKKISILFTEEKARDAEVILTKVLSWRAVSVFLNGNLVRGQAVVRALECKYYYCDSAVNTSVCPYCLDNGNCKKATEKKMIKIVQDQIVKSFKIRLEGPEDGVDGNNFT